MTSRITYVSPPCSACEDQDHGGHSKPSLERTAGLGILPEPPLWKDTDWGTGLVQGHTVQQECNLTPAFSLFPRSVVFSLVHMSTVSLKIENECKLQVREAMRENANKPDTGKKGNHTSASSHLFTLMLNLPKTFEAE